MPDVETPTQASLKAWVPVAKTVTDARGRVLVYKPHNLLSKMQLIGVIGSEKSKNPVYMGYLLIVSSVQSIDGVPVLRPRTMEQVEQLISDIDDDGVAAIILDGEATDEAAAPTDA